MRQVVLDHLGVSEAGCTGGGPVPASGLVGMGELPLETRAALATAGTQLGALGHREGSTEARCVGGGGSPPCSPRWKSPGQ